MTSQKFSKINLCYFYTYTKLKKKKSPRKNEKEAIFANKTLLTFPSSAVWSALYCNILRRLRLPTINLWRRASNRSVAAITLDVCGVWLLSIMDCTDDT